MGKTIVNETNQKVMTAENPSNEYVALKATFFRWLENNLLPLVPFKVKKLSSAQFVGKD